MVGLVLVVLVILHLVDFLVIADYKHYLHYSIPQHCHQRYFVHHFHNLLVLRHTHYNYVLSMDGNNVRRDLGRLVVQGRLVNRLFVSNTDRLLHHRCPLVRHMVVVLSAVVKLE